MYKIGSQEIARPACDNELRATVYFPVNCVYKCPFCTSKELYSKYQANPGKVLDWVDAIGKSRITVVVITGGEPFGDMSMLEEMLKRLQGKQVFINSTMMAASVLGASDILSRYDNIVGISVSRHTPSWEEDVKVFYGREYWRHAPQAHDADVLGLPAKSVRVNAVVKGYTMEPDYVKGIVDRWDRQFPGHPGLGLSFREDYNMITQENLHVTDNTMLRILTSEQLGLEFIGQSDCHVCDNMLFRTKNGMEVRYHRGLAKTRLHLGNLVEIESLVLFPDGLLATDWDRTIDGLSEYCEHTGVQLVC